MNKFANCWPDEEQTLLLKAALMANDRDARACWDQFCQAVDIQEIEYSTTSMTPLVYKKFRDIQGPEMAVAKSVYRHTWATNNLSLHALRKVLTAFARAGISVTLLKGIAMIDSYYRDPGLRVVGDIDILVTKDHRSAAIKLLRGLGWEQLVKINEHQLNYTHATPFKNADGVIIDLHWRILSDAAFDHSLADFQHQDQASVGLLALTLCPEDQLLHTLLHCHKYSPVPLIRWIPDASIVLNSTSDFKWDYFLETVKRLRVEYVVKNALLYLNDEKFINLPKNILVGVKSLCWTNADKQYFDFLTKPRGEYLYYYFYIWHLHFRNNPNFGLIRLIYTLPEFVMNSMSLSGYGELLRYELSRCSRYLKKYFAH